VEFILKVKINRKLHEGEKKSSVLCPCEFPQLFMGTWTVVVWIHDFDTYGTKNNFIELKFNHVE